MRTKERLAYIAIPASGEVLQVSLEDFGKVVKHKVSAQPLRYSDLKVMNRIKRQFDNVLIVIKLLISTSQ